MSHIVIHDDVDGVTQYRQFDDLGNAVTFLEEQQNAAGVAAAKLYELNEVHFEVKSYVKIEIVDGDTAPVEVAAPAEMVAEPAPVPEPVAVAPDEVTPAAEMSYVEAAMAEPIETFASEAFAPVDATPEFAGPEPEAVDSNPGADVRRGLFGR